MLPGSPGGVLPPGRVMQPAEIDAGLDQVEAQALALGNTIFDAIDQRIAALTATRNDVANTVEGSQESRLAALDQTAGRIGGKLIKSLDRQLGQAYTYAFPLGIVYPTNEQALYGLATGDYGGSMGLPYPVNGPGYAPAGAPPVPNPNPAPGDLTGGAGGGRAAGPGGIVTLPAFVPQPEVIPFGGQGPLPTPGPVSPPVGPPIGPPVPIPPVPGSPPLPLPDPTKPPGPGNCPPGMTWFPNADGMGGSCQFPAVGGTGTGPPLLCPPGQVPNPNYHPDGGVWSPVEGDDPYGSHSSADGTPCALPTKIATFAVWGNNNVVNRDGVWYWAGTPPQGLFGVPEPKGRWDVVCITPLVIAPPAIFGPQICVYVPAGDKLFQDPSTGFILSAPTIPPWGCPLGVSARRRWVMAVGPNGEPGGGPACLPGGVEPPPPTPEVCAPPPFVCPDPGKIQGIPIGGGGGDGCKEIAEILGAVDLLGDMLGSVFSMTGTGGPSGSSVVDSIVKAVTGGSGPMLPALAGRLGHYLKKLVGDLLKGSKCDGTQLIPLALYRAAIEFVQKYTAVLPPAFMVPLEYATNTSCPYNLPTVGQADQAYLDGAIPDDTWECWVKAHGHRPAEARTVRDGKRERPTVHQAVQLYYRQLIDQPRRDALVAQAGVLRDDDKQNLLDWEKPFPSVGEAFRWAGEQLYDDDTVNRFELDDGWDVLQQTDFVDLVNGHGLDQKYALQHWRAHWQRPGVRELLEMQQRFRPDRVPADVVFTDDDLDAALKQHGFNDYWTRRIKELSKKVAQRRDVQRLYQYHIIDEQGMKDLLQDQGYESDFADQLVESWKANRKQTEYRANGGYPVSRMVTLYAQGLMTRNELSGLAADVAYYPGQDQEIIDNADQARQIEERRLAVSGLKGAFTKGLIGIADAQAQLAQTGMDADAIQELTGYWERVKKSKPKQVPAGTLCQWRTDGLISMAEQFNALVQLGYTTADARYIVDDCALKIEKATQKQQIAAANKAEAAAKKAEAAAEKAARNAKIRVRVKTPAAPPATANGQAGH